MSSKAKSKNKTNSNDPILKAINRAAKSAMTSALASGVQPVIKTKLAELAKKRATVWVTKNQALLTELMDKEVDRNLKLHLPKAVKDAAKNIKILAPVARRTHRYY